MSELNKYTLNDEDIVNKSNAELEQMINDVQIVYYDNAVALLAEQDPSFVHSLHAASEQGYDVDDLDSELLATLLIQYLERKRLLNEAECV